MEFEPDPVKILYTSMDKTLTAIAQIVRRHYTGKSYKDKVAKLLKQYRKYQTEKKLVTTIQDQYAVMVRYEKILTKKFWEILFDKTVRYHNNEYKREKNPYDEDFGDINRMANQSGNFLRDLFLTFYPLPPLSYRSADECMVYHNKRGTIIPVHSNLPELDLANFIRIHLMELYSMMYSKNISISSKLRLLRYFILLLAPYIDYVYAGGGRGVPNVPIDKAFESFDDIRKLRMKVMDMITQQPQVSKKISVTNTLAVTSSNKLNLVKQFITAIVSSHTILNATVSERYIDELVDAFFDRARAHGDYLHAVIPKLQGVGFRCSLSDIIDDPHTYILFDEWVYVTEVPVDNRSHTGQIDGLLCRVVASEADTGILYVIAVIERKTIRNESTRFVGKQRNAEKPSPFLQTKVVTIDTDQFIAEATRMMHTNHPYVNQVNTYTDMILRQWQLTYPQFDVIRPYRIILVEDQSVPPSKLATEELELLRRFIKMIQDTDDPVEGMFSTDTSGLLYLIKPAADQMAAIVAAEKSTTQQKPVHQPFAEGPSNLVPVFMVKGRHNSGPITSFRSSLKYLLDTVVQTDNALLVDITGFLDVLIDCKLLDHLEISTDIDHISHSILYDTTLDQLMRSINEYDNIDNIIVTGWSFIKQVYTLRQQATIGMRIYQILRNQAKTIYWLDTPVDGNRFAQSYLELTKYPYLMTKQPLKYSFYAGIMTEMYWNLPLVPIALKTKRPLHDEYRILIHCTADKIDQPEIIEFPELKGYSRQFSNTGRSPEVSRPVPEYDANMFNDILDLLPWIAQFYPQYQSDPPSSDTTEPLTRVIPVFQDLVSPVSYDPTMPIRKNSNYVEVDEIETVFTPRNADRRSNQPTKHTFKPLPQHLYEFTGKPDIDLGIRRELRYTGSIIDRIRTGSNAFDQVELPETVEFGSVSAILELHRSIQQSASLKFYGFLTDHQIEFLERHQVSTVDAGGYIGGWLVITLAVVTEDQNLLHDQITWLWNRYCSWILYQLGADSKLAETKPVLSMSEIIRSINRDLKRLRASTMTIPGADMLTGVESIFHSFSTASMLLGDKQFLIAIRQPDGTLLYGRFKQQSVNAVFDHELIEFSMGIDGIDLEEVQSYELVPIIIFQSETTMYLAIEDTGTFRICAELELRTREQHILGISYWHSTPVRDNRIRIDPGNIPSYPIPSFQQLHQNLKTLRDTVHDVTPVLSIDTLRKQFRISFVTADTSEGEATKTVIYETYFVGVLETALFLKSCQFSPDNQYVTETGIALRWDVYELELDQIEDDMTVLFEVKSFCHSKATIIRDELHANGERYVADLLNLKPSDINLILDHDDKLCNCSTAPVPKPASSYVVDPSGSPTPHQGFFLAPATPSDEARFQQIFDDTEHAFVSTDRILQIYRVGHILTDRDYTTTITTSDEVKRMMREDFYLLQVYKMMTGNFHAQLLEFNTYQTAPSYVRYIGYTRGKFEYSFSYFDEEEGGEYMVNVANSNSVCQLMDQLESEIDQFHDTGEFLNLGEVQNPDDLDLSLTEIEDNITTHRQDCRVCILDTDYEGQVIDIVMDLEKEPYVLEVKVDTGDTLEYMISEGTDDLQEELLEFILASFQTDKFSPYVISEEVDSEDVPWQNFLIAYLQDDFISGMDNLVAVLEITARFFKILPEESADTFAQMIVHTLEGRDVRTIGECYACEATSIIVQGISVCEDHLSDFEAIIKGTPLFADCDDWVIREPEEQMDYWIDQIQASESRDEQIQLLDKLYDVSNYYMARLRYQIYRFKIRIEQARLSYQINNNDTALQLLDEALKLYDQFPQEYREKYAIDIPDDNHEFWDALDHSLFSILYYKYENFVILAETVKFNFLTQVDYYQLAYRNLSHARSLAREKENTNYQLMVLYAMSTTSIFLDDFNTMDLVDEGIRLSSNNELDDLKIQFRLVRVNFNIKQYQFGKAIDELEYLEKYKNVTEIQLIEMNDLYVRIHMHTFQFDDAEMLLLKQIVQKKRFSTDYDVIKSYYELLLIYLQQNRTAKFKITLEEIKENQPIKSTLHTQFKLASEILSAIVYTRNYEHYYSIIEHIESTIVYISLQEELYWLILDHLISNNKIDNDNKASIISIIKINSNRLESKIESYCEGILKDHITSSRSNKIMSELLSKEEINTIHRFTEITLNNYCKARLCII